MAAAAAAAAVAAEAVAAVAAEAVAGNIKGKGRTEEGVSLFSAAPRDDGCDESLHRLVCVEPEQKEAPVDAVTWFVCLSSSFFTAAAADMSVGVSAERARRPRRKHELLQLVRVGLEASVHRVPLANHPLHRAPVSWRRRETERRESFRR